MKNQEILFKPFTPADLPIFESWIQKPFIYKWFCPYGESDKREWLEESADIPVNTKPINHFIIYINDKKIGFAQCIDISSVPGYAMEVYSDLVGTLEHTQAYELSYLLGEEYVVGKGLGKTIIRMLIEEVRKRGGRLVIADPGEENIPSVRVLISNGFTKYKDGDYRKVLQDASSDSHA